MIEVVLAIQAVLLLGGGWVARTLLQQLRALKGTVDTQAATISSLSGLVSTLKTVLESTDEPKMLQRLKAYKEFADHEMKVEISKQTALLEQEKQEWSHKLKNV